MRMMPSTKAELLVDWGLNETEISEKTIIALRNLQGVDKVELREGAVLVESTLPSSELLAHAERASGCRAVLQGFGEKISAVVQVSGSAGTVGVVRMQQAGGALVLDGAVDGLEPGEHALTFHTTGDLSQGCNSLGEVYGEGAGVVGTVAADDGGRAVFRILHQHMQLNDIIGRSLAISEKLDQSTNENTDLSQIKKVGCGIVARSAGVLGNPKRVCACDGVVVWDERDRPSAGRGRSQRPTTEHHCCTKRRHS